MSGPLLDHPELPVADARGRLRLDPVKDALEPIASREAARQAPAVRQPQQQLHHLRARLRLGPERQGLQPRRLQAPPLALLRLPGGLLLAEAPLLLSSQLRLRVLAGQHLYCEVGVQQRQLWFRLQCLYHQLVGDTLMPDGQPVTLAQRSVPTQRLLQHVLQVDPESRRAAHVEALTARLEGDAALAAAGQPGVAHLHLRHRRQGAQAGALGEA
mmetsp:Transcript_109739/g.297588  ORF Transcript_109739/g.297588 Transcript_109739/m.297588 type:complete len:214 (-) Transcript_109739:23-664(-)